MGFLDDVIKTVREAIDDASPKPPPQQRRSDRAPTGGRNDPYDLDGDGTITLAEFERAKAKEKRQRQERREQAARQHQKRSQTQRQPPVAITVPDHARYRPEASQATDTRLLAMLRDPHAVRDAVLLQEILGPPISKRARRGLGRRN